MSDLREAARAAVHLTKQLRAVLVVGEALEQIANLDDSRDEAIRLQGEEAAKLLEIKEKIVAADEERNKIEITTERSVAAALEADGEVRAKLEQADVDAREILNVAERLANEKRDAQEAAFVAKADEYEVELEFAQKQLASTKSQVADAEKALEAFKAERAELIATLS